MGIWLALVSGFLLTCNSNTWALVGMAHDNYTNIILIIMPIRRVRNLLQLMYNKVCRLYRLTEWSWANIPKDDVHLSLGQTQCTIEQCHAAK